MDARVTLNRPPTHDQARTIILVQGIKALLHGDIQGRAAETGAAVEYLLASNTTLVKEAWQRMRVWYTDETNWTPNPAHISITNMKTEKVDLYARMTPQGGIYRWG